MRSKRAIEERKNESSRISEENVPELQSDSTQSRRAGDLYGSSPQAAARVNVPYLAINPLCGLKARKELVKSAVCLWISGF